MIGDGRPTRGAEADRGPIAKLHPDFAHLKVRPGRAIVAAQGELFQMVNLLELGGSAAKVVEEPVTLGELDGWTFWESTGDPVGTPFWITSFLGDLWLFLVDGEVRVDFKIPETDKGLATYECRTGDFFRLPAGIARRFFGNGKRRISLEIIRADPLRKRGAGFDRILPLAADELGRFQFRTEAGRVIVATPGDTVSIDPDDFRRGLDWLIRFELYLEHHEFDGGFVIHDQGDRVVLKTRHYQESFEPVAVAGLLKGLRSRIS